MVAERALTILVPRQLGIITNELTKAAGTNQMPWFEIDNWMLLAFLDSQAGLQWIKRILQMPVEQYGYQALSKSAFRHMMGLSMSFPNEKNSGGLVRAIEQGTMIRG